MKGQKEILSQAIAMTTIHNFSPGAAPDTADDRTLELIRLHRLTNLRLSEAIAAQAEHAETIGARAQDILREPHVQWGTRAPGEPWYLCSHEDIDKRIAPFCSPKDLAGLHAELERDGIELLAKRDDAGVTAWNNLVERLERDLTDATLALAINVPLSLQTVAALLEYANESEDVFAEQFHCITRRTTALALERMIAVGTA